MKRFFHTGDIGDIIAFLPVIRHLGGGELVIGGICGDRTMKGHRFEALLPLLQTVPFLSSIEYDDRPVGITHDMENFRERYDTHRSLTASQAMYLGLGEIDMSPWLKVEKADKSAGRVVVARSLRYQSIYFPWRKIVSKFKRRMLFVGHLGEHAEFQQAIRQPVEYCRTLDFLELARIIAGSDLFVGNQSSPCWVAMAMGHPVIQETNRFNPDSMVLRPNAQFCPGQEVNL